MMKTIEKKRSKSEDRHVNADPKIEVKLLRSQSGQVIFLETRRDFVELLFAIMNAPLSSLISNFSQGVNDLHPFLDLKESLQNLGPQSFASGKAGAAFIPKACSTKELRDWAKEKAKASSNPNTQTEILWQSLEHKFHQPKIHASRLLALDTEAKGAPQCNQPFASCQYQPNANGKHPNYGKAPAQETSQQGTRPNHGETRLGHQGNSLGTHCWKPRSFQAGSKKHLIQVRLSQVQVGTNHKKSHTQQAETSVFHGSLTEKPKASASVHHKSGSGQDAYSSE